jgi:hypothetical protein
MDNIDSSVLTPPKLSHAKMYFVSNKKTLPFFVEEL